MEMIIISTPSEFIVLPPHPLTKDTRQTFTLKLGYMRNSPSTVSELEKLESLRVRTEIRNCYVVFRIQEDFFLGQLKQMIIHYALSFKDGRLYYKKEEPRMVDIHCDTPSQEEYEEMIRAVLMSCSKNFVLSSLDWGSYYEIQSFQVAILERKGYEDLEDLRNIGISVLTLLGRK